MTGKAVPFSNDGRSPLTGRAVPFSNDGRSPLTGRAVPFSNDGRSPLLASAFFGASCDGKHGKLLPALLMNEATTIHVLAGLVFG